MDFLFTLNYLLALGGLGLLVGTIGLYIDYYYLESKYYKELVEEYAWYFIIATTVGSVALSLVYSEYYGFIPCSLCWLQRIALYPQALFVLMAYKIKDQVYFPLYSIALSLFGLAVAIYQYIYQMLPHEEASGMILPCLADGSGDCAAKIINEFGFVTFPFLSAVTFVFLIVMYLNLRRSSVTSAVASKI
jgi:disulfide bond formation protein DsbB